MVRPYPALLVVHLLVLTESKWYPLGQLRAGIVTDGVTVDLSGIIVAVVVVVVIVIIIIIVIILAVFIIFIFLIIIVIVIIAGFVVVVAAVVIVIVCMYIVFLFQQTCNIKRYNSTKRTLCKKRYTI